MKTKLLLPVTSLLIAAMVLALAVTCLADVSADIKAAEDLMMDGKDGADTAFAAILSSNPALAAEHPDDFARVQLGLASCLDNAGKYREAIEAAKTGIAVACQDRDVKVELKSRLALDYQMVKDYTASVAEFQALVKDYPEFARAWQMDIAKGYEALGKYADSIAVLDQIGEARRDEREDASYAKARLLVRQMADYDKGTEVAQAFLRDYPCSVHAEDVSAMLALALQKLGRQQAVNTLSKPAAKEPNKADYDFIEDLLYVKNQPAQAREACKKLVNAGVGSDDARLAFLSASCLYAEGNWSTAKDAFQSFYDHYAFSKYHIQAQYYIGDCCIRLGDKEAGRKAFLEIAEAPSDPTWAELAVRRLLIPE